MKNLLKFELRKLFTSVSFYVLLIISIAGALLQGFLFVLGTSILIPEEIDFDFSELKIGYEFVKTALASFFPAIVSLFVPIFICTDFSNGTIKNIFSKGYKREEVLLAKYISSLLSVFIFAIFTVVTSILFASILFKPGEIDSNLAVVIFGQIIGIITLHSLYFFISYSLQKMGRSIVVSILGVSLVDTLFALAQLFVAETNPALEINITHFWVTEAFSIFTTELTAKVLPVRTAFISLSMSLVIFDGLSFIINRRREIR